MYLFYNTVPQDNGIVIYFSEQTEEKKIHFFTTYGLNCSYFKKKIKTKQQVWTYCHYIAGFGVQILPEMGELPTFSHLARKSFEKQVLQPSIVSVLENKNIKQIIRANH